MRRLGPLQRQPRNHYCHRSETSRPSHRPCSSPGSPSRRRWWSPWCMRARRQRARTTERRAFDDDSGPSAQFNRSFARDSLVFGRLCRLPMSVSGAMPIATAVAAVVLLIVMELQQIGRPGRSVWPYLLPVGSVPLVGAAVAFKHVAAHQPTALAIVAATAMCTVVVTSSAAL